MSYKNRLLALLLTTCMLFSMLSVTVSAAAPTKMTVSAIAAGSAKVATDIQSAIKSGKTDANGIYSDVVVPSAVAVGAYTMGVEDYVLMAAQAIRTISEGGAKTTNIYYRDVTLTQDTASGASANSVTSDMILDLAERVQKYGTMDKQLPTSYNRPSDASKTYNGRICIYSIAHIFALALASYNTNGKLPDSVTFVPTSYTTSATSAPIEPDVTEPAVDDTYAQVIAAAVQTKAYVDDKEAIPSSIKVGSKTYGLSEFSHLIAQVIVNINSGVTSGSLEILTLSEPGNPNETVTAGTLTKTEYLDLASRTVTWNRNNGVGANYMNSSLGHIHHHEAIYLYCTILNYYNTNKVLPDSAKIYTWAKLTGFTAGDATFGADFSAYAKYLVPTRNCQSTNATLMSIAKTGMVYGSTPSNTYQAMYNLFEYLNSKVSYEYYMNTSRGGYGTWRDKEGNCCDMAHLMNACARSLGVPGRYRHGYCYFNSGLNVGHVWSDVFCGKQFASYDNYNSDGWLTADMVSDYNYLGYKTNRTSYFYGDDKCAELGF